MFSTSYFLRIRTLSFELNLRAKLRIQKMNANVHLILQVQLNIQPVNKDGHQKINIIDVLKIDPDEENFADKNGVDSADENSSSNLVKNLS